MKAEQEVSSKVGNKAKNKAVIALLFFILFGLLVYFANPDDLYLWLKSLHIIAVISWMAGLLYLPRLFIYQSDSIVGTAQYKTFSIMQTRLITVIMNPAMVITWFIGLFITYNYYGFDLNWIKIKLGLVLLLTITHLYLAFNARSLNKGIVTKTAKHWRLVNEIPTVLMILIVITVVVKPFS